MPIFHDTSIECAIAIVQDAFRVSPYMILEDQCTNFHEGRLNSQIPNTGCRMEFAWAGPVEEFNKRSVADMRPNVLYRQNWEGGGFWRLALRPGTRDGLTFVRAVYSTENPAQRGIYDEAERIFRRAAGRAIPVRFHGDETKKKA